MRLFILALSMGSVVSFGYALAGYGGHAFGKGRTDYVVWGLVGGVVLALAAMTLWKKWMPRFMMSEEEAAELEKSLIEKELEEEAAKEAKRKNDQ